MTQIEIIVSPNGQTKVETKGFSGAACREASQYIEAALGKPTAERLTAEYYQPGSVGQTIEEAQS